MLVLLGAALLLPLNHGFAQNNKAEPRAFLPALPFSLEWNESFNPLTPKKLAADGFAFRGGSKNFKMQFSTQAPPILGGKQFSWMPGGYQLAELSLSRKWGSIQGFQSLRYNSRVVVPDSARTISGAGVESPKSILGARLTAYFLHSAPTSTTWREQSSSMTAAAGNQIGFTLARDLRKSGKLLAEWAESWHESSHTAALSPLGSFGGGGLSAFRLGLDGAPAKTELSSTLVIRSEGLTNPAAPVYNPGKKNIRLNVRRKLNGHQVQYSVQMDDQRASSFLRSVYSRILEQTAEWSFTQKGLPRIAASQSLSFQTVAGREEEERGFRLSIARSIRGTNATLSLHRALRSDLGTGRPLWHRTVWSGDATIEIYKTRCFHLRYEGNTMALYPSIQKIMSSVLQLDTRVPVWKNKLSLIPTMDFRVQTGSLPAYFLSTTRMALTAQIKAPRWFPAADFLVNLASSNNSSPGRADWSHTDLNMRWNFKREKR